MRTTEYPIPYGKIIHSELRSLCNKRSSIDILLDYCLKIVGELVNREGERLTLSSGTKLPERK